MPVIYANDNFGHWRSDFRQAIGHCLHDGVRGAKLAETLLPDAEDYFIVKPKNSAFYTTPLAELLQFLDVKTLVLTGVATDSCILFTANDAHLRNYSVVVPADCVAAINRKDGKHALDYLQRALNARVVKSASINFKAIKSGKADALSAAFFNFFNHGFVRVAVAISEARVADPKFNVGRTIALMHEAAESAKKAV